MESGACRVMNNLQPYQRKSSRVVYESDWIRVLEDEIIHPDGRPGIYSVIEQPPGQGVWVVALNKKNEVCMVTQFRYPHNQKSIEVPGGFTDHQEPLIAAKRELREETGLAANKWENIGKLNVMSGATRIGGDIFIARELKEVAGVEQEEEGIINCEFVAFNNVIEMIEKQEIIESITISVIFRAGLVTGLIEVAE